MTPKEKAKELIDKLKGFCFHNFDYDAEEMRIGNAKECATILVKEFSRQNKPPIPGNT